MQLRKGFRLPVDHPGVPLRIWRIILLVLPLLSLLTLTILSPAFRSEAWRNGLAILAGLTFLLVVMNRLGQHPLGLAGAIPFLLGEALILFLRLEDSTAAFHFTQAVLFLFPMAIFIRFWLEETGSLTFKRVRRLIRQLERRMDWPRDLLSCRDLPEVLGLRRALVRDPSPVMRLLSHPHDCVRAACLASLEYQTNSRPGQAQLLLQTARAAFDPSIRAMALVSLANVEDRTIIDSLTDFLRDSSPLVRRTAMDMVLWDTETRWHWIRDGVRRSLADPALQNDGSLELPLNQVTPDVERDLHVWANEKGVIALRAGQTLISYYSRCLAGDAPSNMVENLRARLTSPQTPPILRLQLAQMLFEAGELTPEDLKQLLHSSQSASIRLIAVEGLLQQGNQGDALATLQELARMPNREIALSIAAILQKYFSLDMGQGSEPPHAQSIQAAQVAQKVTAWANSLEINQANSSQLNPTEEEDAPDPD
ncbi:MAG: HEAT repeat domain-containing protein [Gemmataceae bacterium]